MEFLDKLVLPQSAEHINLLHLIAIIVQFIFIPFLSLVFGGTLFSIIYRNKGLKEQNPHFIRFSSELINLTTFNNTFGVVLGIVPPLILLLIFSQILHTVQSSAIVYFGTSVLLTVICLILIYTYKYSLNLSLILSTFRNEKDESGNNNYLQEEIEQYQTNFRKANNSTGHWGIIFLLAAAYFYFAGYSTAIHFKMQANVSAWQTLFSLNVILYWLQFIAASLALTSAFTLFYYFSWEGGKKNLIADYAELIKKVSVRTLTISLAILPLFLVINFITTPTVAVSKSFFSFASLALIAIFAVYHFIFQVMKNSKFAYASWIFILVIATYLFTIISNQSTVKSSTRSQAAVLSSNYDVYLKNLKSSGVGGLMTSEQIFKSKCSACHSFDRKIVGPPYKETLPKYEGKTDELVKFIMNPTKKNPGYPPMPAQGLKPAEARAIADYILENYKK